MAFGVDLGGFWVDFGVDLGGFVGWIFERIKTKKITENQRNPKKKPRKKQEKPTKNLSKTVKKTKKNSE